MPGDRPGHAVARLENLAAELAGRGWPAWVDAPPGREYRPGAAAAAAVPPPELAGR
jgi:hypothetical protein